ncbi:MAG TPA: DNA translocase FtsK 4TM domain-containing protein, partial [Candidatus Acidoferrales bacterium]|nr:DNA translocase FtsK 4TM domain-containing protein [Candidatus Acidoferrales bacterium]
MNLLTPGESKRLNELIGFLFFVGAIVLALCLASYSPLDPSLNTAVAPSDAGQPLAQNWIGIIGAYTADILLQALGWVAFGLPLLMLVLAWKWFHSATIESPYSRIAGVLLLLFSVTSLLALVSFPPAHGLMPAGGTLGVLLSLGLIYVLNVPGAAICTVSALVIGAYLLSPFSLADSTRWVGQGAGAAATRSVGVLGWLRAKLKREPSVEAPLIVKPAVLPPRVPQGAAASARPAVAKPAHPLPMPEDEWEEPEVQAEAEEPAGRRSGRPVPVARERYRLPSTALLRPAEHVRAPNEDELQERAAILRAKLEEFDVRGEVVQIT